jgi:hypothetical protein
MDNKIKSRTIVFIHGFFMNRVSWTNWIKFYEKKVISAIHRHARFMSGLGA